MRSFATATNRQRQELLTVTPLIDRSHELFRWWVESDAFKQRQLAALNREIATGIEQLDGGRYHTYDDANVMQLAEDVGRSGRERLKNRDA